MNSELMKKLFTKEFLILQKEEIANEFMNTLLNKVLILLTFLLPLISVSQEYEHYKSLNKWHIQNIVDDYGDPIGVLYNYQTKCKKTNEIIEIRLNYYSGYLTIKRFKNGVFLPYSNEILMMSKKDDIVFPLQNIFNEGFIYCSSDMFFYKLIDEKGSYKNKIAIYEKYSQKLINSFDVDGFGFMETTYELRKKKE